MNGPGGREGWELPRTLNTHWEMDIPIWDKALLYKDRYSFPENLQHASHLNSGSPPILALPTLFLPSLRGNHQTSLSALSHLLMVWLWILIHYFLVDALSYTHFKLSSSCWKAISCLLPSPSLPTIVSIDLAMVLILKELFDWAFTLTGSHTTHSVLISCSLQTYLLSLYGLQTSRKNATR